MKRRIWRGHRFAGQSIWTKSADQIHAASDATTTKHSKHYAANFRFTRLENVELLPFKELPPSPQRQLLEVPRMPSFGAGSYTFGPPSAALVARETMRPVLCKGDDQITSILFGEADLLDEIRMCLSLVGPSTLIPAFHWFQFSDSDLQDAAVGSSYTWSHMEIHPTTLRVFGEFDVSRAAKLVRQYMAIASGDRGRVRLALDRFDRSMRRRNAGDVALELSIALESLLGDGGMELTWKVGLRSALLAGGSRAEQVRLRAIIQSIYSLRGTLAHAGTTPSEVKVRGNGKLKADELIKEGIVAASEVIAAAIEMGQLPDWFEAEIEM